MMMSIHGRSPEPSPCGYDVSGLAAAFASLRRATRSDALAHVGVRKSAPARGLEFARCRPSQQRFRSRECHSGTPSIELVCINEARQEGAVQIALHLPGPIAEHVYALGERLLYVLAGRVVELAEPGAARAELDELATCGRRLPPERRHEHPRPAHLGGAAEGALEGAVRELLGLDLVALGEDTIRELAVRALAFRGQAPLALPALLGEP